MSDNLRAGLSQKLRQLMRTQAQSACLGWVFEGEIFQKLDAARIPFVRGYESANADGAFISPSSDVDITLSVLDTWKWAVQQTTTEFIPFDVKSMCLATSTKASVDYAFRGFNKKHMNPVELYIFVFEDLEDYVAIVPKSVWESASDAAYGTAPLFSKVPSWIAPFVVYLPQLAEAVENLWRKDKYYENPTTKVIFSGFTARRTTSPLIQVSPDSTASWNSFKRVTDFWNKAGSESLGCKFDFNPFAPLICDFLMEVPGHEALRIEHKCLPIKDVMSFSERVNDPFRTNRLWHFFICQDVRSPDRFLCIGRHEFKTCWAQGNSVYNFGEDFEDMIFSGKDNFRDMIKKICKTAEEAVKRAEGILDKMVPQELDVKDLVTSNRVMDIMRQIESGNAPTKRIQHSKGLHWVCKVLNDQCCVNGSMMCFPLDLGHAVGDHVIVEHEWTSDEQLAYDKRGLPRNIFSPDVSERRAVVMRFMDFSHGAYQHTYPLNIRQSYWNMPATTENFMILASTFDSSVMTKSESRMPYLLYPSAFTRQMSQGLRQAAPNIHNGTEFFRRSTVTKDALPTPTFGTNKVEVRRFERGDTESNSFVSSSGANPLRCILDLNDESVYRHLRELMTGEGQMSIQPHVGSNLNPSFSKEEHRTTVASVLQSMWDYGLTRQENRFSEGYEAWVDESYRAGLNPPRKSESF